MARTNYLIVKEILDTEVSNGTIQIYIGMANRLVTEILGEDTTLSSSQLADIECWLTAHMIASSRSRMAKSEKIESASITYTGTFGMYLDSTPYGQMVKQLDTTGKMAKVGKRLATIRAIESF